MLLARREMLSLSVAALLWPNAARAQAGASPNSAGLAAGRFVWEPSQPQRGAVVVAVTLEEQLLRVYKAGALIGISTCRAARGTRVGLYAITDPLPPAPADSARQEPDARALRWSGRLLHAAASWGQPGAAGAVLLPVPFARLLGGVTRLGALGIITDRLTRPAEVEHPQALLPILPAEAGRPRLVTARQLDVALDAPPAPAGIVVLISRADSSAYLVREGAIERRARVRFDRAGDPIGTHVFSLMGGDGPDEAIRWLGFGVTGPTAGPTSTNWRGGSVLEGIAFEERASATAMARALHPGAILIITDDPPTVALRRPPRTTVILAAEAPPEQPVAPRTARRTASPPPEPDIWAKFFPLERR